MIIKEQNKSVEEIDTNFFLDLEKNEKQNLTSSTKSSNRAQSAKPFLLRRLKPKVGPVKSNLNPSKLFLEGPIIYPKNNKQNIDINVNNSIYEEKLEGLEMFFLLHRLILINRSSPFISKMKNNKFRNN